MTNERLVRASDVLVVWDLFHEGFQHLATSKEIYYNELQAKKLVCKLAADHDSGYVSVVFNDEGDPIAFAIFQENTLPFSGFRTFVTRAVFYKQGNSAALLVLFGGFEQWAKAHSVRRYSILTRREITAAKRTFAHPKYGFTKLSLVFEKTL